MNSNLQPERPSAHDQAILTARLKRSPVTDRWCAALACALGEGADIETAIEVADEVAGAGVKLSAGHDVSEQSRGQPENKGEFGPGGGGQAKKPAARQAAKPQAWFSPNSLPKKGDTIAYYDGEGGGSRDAEQVGPVYEVLSDGALRVKSRTGSLVNIPPEAARPYTAPPKAPAPAQKPAQPQAIAPAAPKPPAPAAAQPQKPAGLTPPAVTKALAREFSTDHSGEGVEIGSIYQRMRINDPTFKSLKELHHELHAAADRGEIELVKGDENDPSLSQPDKVMRFEDGSVITRIKPKGAALSSARLFDDDLHPRDDAGKFAKAVNAAKKASANGTLKIHTGKPVRSHVSGRTIKRHVNLDGKKIHPDELARMKVEDGEVYLQDEGLTIHEPGGKSPAPSFNHALRHVAMFKFLMDEPVTIQSAHGYTATRPRLEWADMHKGHDPAQTFSEWHDEEGAAHTGRTIEHDGSAKLASEKDSDAFFAPRDGRSAGLFDPIALSQADKAGNRWITIGAQPGEDGKKHGGSPVCINKAGVIVKGHPSLTGKRADNLRAPAEPSAHHKKLAELKTQPKGTPQQERDKAKQAAKLNANISRADTVTGNAYQMALIRKQARKEGITPKDLHAVAKDMLQHDHAFKQDVTNMLKETRELATAKGGTGSNVHHNAKAFDGGDYTNIKGFDLLAREMAGRYPHLLGNHGYGASEHYDPNESEASEKLYDFLVAGNPKPMTAEQGYTEALDFLRAQKFEEGAGAAAHLASPDTDEPIPFSQAGGTL